MIKNFQTLSKLMQYIPTGSRYICDPPVLNTDEDFVLLVDCPRKNWWQKLLWESRMSLIVAELVGMGYSLTTTVDYRSIYRGSDSNFLTFRKGTENLIVVWDRNYFNRWAVATRLAKQFNLTKKEDRIALFSALRVNK